MANAVSLPIVGEQIALVPSSEPRAAYVYANGTRTDVPRTDDKGQPLYSFEALGQLDGNVNLGTIRVLTPAEHLPATGFGAVLNGAGVGVITIRNGRDGAFDLSVSLVLDGVTAAAPTRTRGE